jgi:hypothetical protein
MESSEVAAEAIRPIKLMEQAQPANPSIPFSKNFRREIDFTISPPSKFQQDKIDLQQDKIDP